MLFIEDIFVSIQGEGVDAGYPCIFVRFFGCSIGCKYCDTKQEICNKKRTSVGKIMSRIHKYGEIKRVCITGGEPMEQVEEMYMLVYELVGDGYDVSIETSGCIPIEPDSYKRSFHYVMDIKCPSSGVAYKNVFSNLAVMTRNDTVKFVVSNKADYDYSKQILKQYPTCAKIIYSPVWGSDIGKDLIKWLIKDKANGARIQTQLHKIFDVK